MLSNTTELHARIDRMTRRIRELEYGLGQLQSTVSSETHELLRDDHPLKDTSVAAAVAASRSGDAPPELPIPESASASSSSGASPPGGPASAVDSTDDEFIDSFGMPTCRYGSRQALIDSDLQGRSASAPMGRLASMVRPREERYVISPSVGVGSYSCLGDSICFR